MFCDIRLKLRRVRACLTIVLASTATLGMPNQALAAYDFSKLGAAIETLSPETVSDWEKKARAGDAMAQNIMGLAYKCGMGVKQNHAASIQWFRRAAEQGEADAQFNLGRLYGSEVDGMYKNGRAAPANDAEAFKWYRLAAEQGHTQAQVRLAQLFCKGLTTRARPGAGIPVDESGRSVGRTDSSKSRCRLCSSNEARTVTASPAAGRGMATPARHKVIRLF